MALFANFERPLLPLTRRGLMHIALPQRIEIFLITFLIFGGCCSNVFTLEAITRYNPTSGSTLTITFVQFLFVAIEGSVHHLHWSSKTLLKPSNVPLKRWCWIALLHFSNSLMNNLSLNFQVSVPVHIVLRSGGSLVTLIVGAVVGRRYSKTQLLSVVAMTLGTVITAMSEMKELKSIAPSSGHLIVGLSLLLLAQVFTAVMAISLEDIYKKYPGTWREGFFYTHCLALPLFLPLLPKISAQICVLAFGAQVQLAIPIFSNIVFNFPVGFFFLTMNAMTQYVCVRGVNLLTASSSALTVGMVLNMRKLTSLLLSIWIFKTQLNGGFIFGTAVVFGSVLIYVLDVSKVKKERRRSSHLLVRRSR